MKHRTGLTLIEVLTAIFIVGLGVIAILTLFPLGAMRMAQAFRDERSALAAFNADKFMRSYWKLHVVEAANPDPFFNDFDDPDGSNSLSPAAPYEPSYPVFVDPMGYVARSGSPTQFWVGEPSSHIPRRTLQSIGNNPGAALAFCSLRDSINANEEGTPLPERELRYNYLWVLQRPVNANRYVAQMTVVVFDRRAPLYAPPGSEQTYSNILFTPGSTQVDIPGVSRSQLELRPGDWVVDGTIYDNTQGRPGIRHAVFYRITALADTPGGVRLELQTPIRTPADGRGPYTGTLIILRGVSGVFVRPLLTNQ